MNALRKELPGPFDDGTTIGTDIDAINSKFTALREAIDKAIAGRPMRARTRPARSSPTMPCSTQASPHCSTSRFAAWRS